MAEEIKVKKFKRFLKLFYANWKENKSTLWKESDIIFVATPPKCEENTWTKSAIFNRWLFGIQLHDLVLIFLDTQVHIVCSDSMVIKFNLLKTHDKLDGIDIVLHAKENNTSAVTLLKEILSGIIVHVKSKNPIVGYMANVSSTEKLFKIILEKHRGIKFREVMNGFSDLFSVKDHSEINSIRKAAFITSVAMKISVIQRLNEVLDEETHISHSSLKAEIVKAIEDPPDITICYPPIFQSGGKFNLGQTAKSKPDFPTYRSSYGSSSIILCAFGSRCNGYCSNIARTFLISPTESQIVAYKVLVDAHKAATFALRPGNKVSAAYLAALTVVENKAPQLVSYLTPHAGSGLGLEFHEKWLRIDERNELFLKAGMVFNVSLGFHDIPFQDSAKMDVFSLLISDTVLVVSDMPPELLTSCSKEQPKFTRCDIRSKSRLPKEMLQSKNDIDRGEISNQNVENEKIGTCSSGPEESYNTIVDAPHSKKLVIQVNYKNEAIVLPIQGKFAQFHISTVKKIDCCEHNKTCTIMIFFKVPGAGTIPPAADGFYSKSSVVLKAASFRSNDIRHCNQVMNRIKDLQRIVAAKESERAERASLVAQENLQLVSNKMTPARLTRLRIRPSFGGRGKQYYGVLEAHKNGFRFSSLSSNQYLDIMYGNIKHAFFQPAEKANITVLHFHLHNMIMVGKKTTLNVQFCTKVVDDVKSSHGVRRFSMDPDETQEEKKEWDKINTTNSNFQNFVDKVQKNWVKDGYELDFQKPQRELGFQGVHENVSGFICPTTKCLVDLIEMPCLIISLIEIEIVNLERAVGGLRNFDMRFIFKDFKKEVCQIDSIPISSLQRIKAFLEINSLKFYETATNLNWPEIMNGISDDPQRFIDQGGWEFLNLEKNMSDSDNGQDETYVQSESSEDDEIQLELSEDRGELFEDHKSEEVTNKMDSSEQSELESNAVKQGLDQKYVSRSGSTNEERKDLAEIGIALLKKIDVLVKTIEELQNNLPGTRPLKECFKILDALELPSDSALKAIRLLQKKDMAETFVALPESKRLWWLQCEADF